MKLKGSSGLAQLVLDLRKREKKNLEKKKIRKKKKLRKKKKKARRSSSHPSRPSLGQQR